MRLYTKFIGAEQLPESKGRTLSAKFNPPSSPNLGTGPLNIEHPIVGLEMSQRGYFVTWLVPNDWKP